MLDYTGKKYDNLPPGLPANLSKIMFVKEGHEASDIATDVRKSLEVEKENQDGYGNSGTTTQREDESVK